MSDMPSYLARLANPAGEKNAFSKLFDEMPGADDVRAGSKKTRINSGQSTQRRRPV
jgi:hypothetical protein